MLTNEQFTCLARRYIDTVYRVAFNYIKSPADADDITQNVFLKLLQTPKPFESDDHVKNWLIRVTIILYKMFFASLTAIWQGATIDTILFLRFQNIFSFCATFSYKVRTTRVRSKKKGSDPKWKILR